MRRYGSVKRLGALVLAAVLSVSAAFVSEAAASFKAEVPVTLHLDVNSRRTTIYDGYSSYLLGYRVSEYDTFTVTKDKSDVDLNEVTLNYYLVTYRGETQKYLECTVYGLKEGTHYPVIRPETVEKERSAAGLFMTDTCADEIISQAQPYLLSAEHNLMGTEFNAKIDAME